MRSLGCLTNHVRSGYFTSDLVTRPSPISAGMRSQTVVVTTAK